MLMFGPELRVRLDPLVGRPREESGSQSYLEYAQRLPTSLESIRRPVANG